MQLLACFYLYCKRVSQNTTVHNWKLSYTHIHSIHKSTQTVNYILECTSNGVSLDSKRIKSIKRANKLVALFLFLCIET